MKYGTDGRQTRTKKNCYQFNVDKDRKIQISSNFDGGNISLIKQVTELQYRLEPVPDVANSTNKKSWFYFSVSAPKHFKLRFYIQSISIYESMYQQSTWGKPVYKIGQQGTWQTLKDSYLIYRDQVNLMIDYNFQTAQTIYIALSIPFTYWEMEDYINGLKYTVPHSIAFQDQIIKETKTGKNLHLLTIQDKTLKSYKEKSATPRFIIFVTARVHPGEVSGTYCLMGMLDFILRPFSLQSQILRKMFTFVIVPMVNPEGVYEGNYRMDLNGQNLNRVYLDPHPCRHETVFAIKEKVAEFLKKGDRIMFHFDLHAHSTMRRSFIYGNAFDDIIVQTQTQIFCRLLDKNCEYFQETLSQFGQKHMKFKDKGENMSKQGCARVVISKMAAITYSYTVESSIFPVQQKSFSEKYQKYEPINLDFQLESIGENMCNFSYDDFENQEKRYSSEPNVIDQNKNLGVKIMVSILDLVMKNPYSCLEQKDFDEMRKQISTRILQNEERFKMLDTKAYHKSKFISQFAKSQFNSKFKDQWNWLALEKQFCQVKWPERFEWFKPKPIVEPIKQRKSRKTKTQTKEPKISSGEEIQISSFKVFPGSLFSNRLKFTDHIEDLKDEFDKLPLIRKSLETKRFKTDEKDEFAERKQDKIANFKYTRNILATNRSNILLTFLDQVEEKKEQRRLSKKRMASLKMASLSKNSVQRNTNSEKLPDNLVDIIESDFVGLKPSHSQGQLTIQVFHQERPKSNDEQGLEFEDKFLTKNIETKKSRKQLLSKKISMLKKVNQCKKQFNKNAVMKFPEIGKAFLITNAKRKFQKLKTTLEDGQIVEERSTVEVNIYGEGRNLAIDRNKISQNDKLKNTTHRIHNDGFDPSY